MATLWQMQQTALFNHIEKLNKSIESMSAKVESVTRDMDVVYFTDAGSKAHTNIDCTHICGAETIQEEHLTEEMFAFLRKNKMICSACEKSD